MNRRRVVIVGGGAAGFFAALACAEACCPDQILILEKSPGLLSKVRISGGGRCNVTHACFDPLEFVTRYPRGRKELIGPFQRFQARDTVEWFAAHGVPLKTEPDGRMFPTTDTSQTIVECLQTAARNAGIQVATRCAVDTLTQRADGRWELTLSGEGRGAIQANSLVCDCVLLATGGCRTAAQARLAAALGHTIEPPVPSLFTLHLDAAWLRNLAGVSVESVELCVPHTGLRERGPLLITHSGLSGPAVLRLSAWGARELAALDYRFPLCINWLPGLAAEQLAAELQARRQSQGGKRLVNTPVAPLSARLWEQLVLEAGIAPATRCSALSRTDQQRLLQQLAQTELPVTGKSLNKDEFVTCGGVRLREVNFKTMESRICPNLFFAGELLDIDGITGGFNFQAAWTTGWIAGRAMADRRMTPAAHA
jgi:hypothetical protein